MPLKIKNLIFFLVYGRIWIRTIITVITDLGGPKSGTLYLAESDGCVLPDLEALRSARALAAWPLLRHCCMLSMAASF